MRLSRPCPLDLKATPGPQHCAHCDKIVHDLRAASTEEVAQRRAEGACGIFLRRPGGRVATRGMAATALVIALAMPTEGQAEPPTRHDTATTPAQGSTGPLATLDTGDAQDTSTDEFAEPTPEAEPSSAARPSPSRRRSAPTRPPPLPRSPTALEVLLARASALLERSADELLDLQKAHLKDLSERATALRLLADGLVDRLLHGPSPDGPEQEYEDYNFGAL